MSAVAKSGIAGGSPPVNIGNASETSFGVSPPNLVRGVFDLKVRREAAGVAVAVIQVEILHIEC